MEDDDLEYDITFPSPNTADLDQINPEGLLNRAEPVVILLGWLGCKEKYLLKYGEIYDKAGCITIKYTSPRDVAFFNVEKLRDIACKILDLLDDYSITENPIMFHIFSNNGSYVYANIVDVLTSRDSRYKNLNVCGVVIDSAPGKPRLTRAAAAYASSHSVNVVYRFIVMIGMFLYLFGSGLVYWIATMFSPGLKQKSNFYLYDNMASDPTRWPMLFLYSTADKIIYACDVEDMISRRKKLGVHVDAVCWDDTDHVSHLRKHAQEYSDACQDFLAFCTGSGNDGAEGTNEDFDTSDYLGTKTE
ncbi:Transmembrane protein 53 [Mactra antiquata]